MDAWIKKHILDKFKKYKKARQHLKGYKDAPIGFEFEGGELDADFKKAVQEAIDGLKAANPGIKIEVKFN